MSLNVMQFVLYQVMSFEVETLLPEKKRNRTGLKERENSHGNVLAALKTPGTFNKHNTQNKGQMGTWRTGKSFGSEATEGHWAFTPLPLTLFQSGKQTPRLEPGSLSVTLSLKCPTYVTEMCTSSSLHKETSSLAGTLFLPRNEDLTGPMLIIH